MKLMLSQILITLNLLNLMQRILDLTTNVKNEFGLRNSSLCSRLWREREREREGEREREREREKTCHE